VSGAPRRLWKTTSEPRKAMAGQQESRTDPMSECMAVLSRRAGWVLRLRRLDELKRLDHRRELVDVRRR
jgi:hypothetical protein